MVMTVPVDLAIPARVARHMMALADLRIADPEVPVMRDQAVRHTMDRGDLPTQGQGGRCHGRRAVLHMTGQVDRHTAVQVEPAMPDRVGHATLARGGMGVSVRQYADSSSGCTQRLDEQGAYS